MCTDKLILTKVYSIELQPRPQQISKMESIAAIVNGIKPSRPNPGRREKSKLNFYFHTLWCLETFYEGLKGLHKTFRGTSKSDNKDLT